VPLCCQRQSYNPGRVAFDDYAADKRSLVKKARRAIGAMFSGATLTLFGRWGRFVPPAAARAATPQRGVSTTGTRLLVKDMFPD